MGAVRNIQIPVHGCFTVYSANFWSGPADAFSTGCNRHPHLDPVLLMVVNERDGFVVLLHAVRGDAHLAIPGGGSQDRDVGRWSRDSGSES